METQLCQDRTKQSCFKSADVYCFKCQKSFCQAHRKIHQNNGHQLLFFKDLLNHVNKLFNVFEYNKCLSIIRENQQQVLKKFQKIVRMKMIEVQNLLYQCDKIFAKTLNKQEKDTCIALTKHSFNEVNIKIATELKKKTGSGFNNINIETSQKLEKQSKSRSKIIKDMMEEEIRNKNWKDVEMFNRFSWEIQRTSSNKKNKMFKIFCSHQLKGQQGIKQNCKMPTSKYQLPGFVSFILEVSQ